MHARLAWPRALSLSCQGVNRPEVRQEVRHKEDGTYLGNKVKPGTQNPGRMFVLSAAEPTKEASSMWLYELLCNPCFTYMLTCLRGPWISSMPGDNRSGTVQETTHRHPAQPVLALAPLSLICKPSSLPPSPSTPQEKFNTQPPKAAQPHDKPSSTRPQTSQEGDRGPVLFNRPSSRPNVLASTISRTEEPVLFSALVPCRRSATTGPGADPLQYPARTEPVLFSALVP